MSAMGGLIALASAALFGISVPAAKYFLGSIDPWLLAGLCYAGSGLGLALVRLVRARTLKNEAPIARTDIPWLAGAIASGGIVGPLLLFWGLIRIDASSASLLLVLEGVFTALIASLVFREHYHGRVVVGMAAITAGAVVLAWPSGGVHYDPLGTLAIAAACLAWAVDNNLTRKVSIKDPIEIAMLKGLVAGAVNIALAFGQGSALPGVESLAAVAAIGFVGYGISLVLFVLALRQVGAARTGAYFSTAPFIGAASALLLLHEPVTASLGLAGLLMGFGTWLHLTERHEHEHLHSGLAHSHSHAHDIHHRHQHLGDEPPGEPHTHFHRHQPLRHSHPHFADSHHLHEH